MHKKNFEAHTNLKPLKKNAVQLCGAEFVNSLTAKGIYAKVDEFWQEINKNQNIPDNAYYQKKVIEQAKREAILAEERAREKAEIENLIANKTEVFTKDRSGWKITVFELPATDKYGNKFVAECTTAPDLKLNTYFSKSQTDAYSQACNIVDKFEKEQQELIRFSEHYIVLKPLYLMLIYLSGSDQYDPYLGKYKEKRCRENFIGINSWNGFDFEIINYLESEGLLQLSATRRSLTMTKKGMKVAIDSLKKINIEGLQTLLEKREYHEDYIHYQSDLDILPEQDKE
jgi:hypothetical protein